MKTSLPGRLDLVVQSDAALDRCNKRGNKPEKLNHINLCIFNRLGGSSRRGSPPPQGTKNTVQDIDFIGVIRGGEMPGIATPAKAYRDLRS